MSSFPRTSAQQQQRHTSTALVEQQSSSSSSSSSSSASAAAHHKGFGTHHTWYHWISARVETGASCMKKWLIADAFARTHIGTKPLKNIQTFDKFRWNHIIGEIQLQNFPTPSPLDSRLRYTGVLHITVVVYSWCIPRTKGVSICPEKSRWLNGNRWFVRCVKGWRQPWPTLCIVGGVIPVSSTAVPGRI